MPRQIPLLEQYCPLQGGLTSPGNQGMAASGEQSSSWAEEIVWLFVGYQSGWISQHEHVCEREAEGVWTCECVHLFDLSFDFFKGIDLCFDAGSPKGGDNSFYKSFYLFFPPPSPPYSPFLS